jgi:hypothetical protein
MFVGNRFLRFELGFRTITNFSGNRVNQDLAALIHSCSTAPKKDQRLCLPLGSTTANFSNEEADLLKFCCINQTLIGQLQLGNRRERQK